MPNGSNPAFVSTQGERLPVRRNKDGSVMMDERGLLDLPFLVLVVLLVTIGVIMVFSSSYARAYYKEGNSTYYFARQAIFAVLGIGVMLSTIIESCQLIFRLGNCDVDDILANTFGALLGLVLYKIVHHSSRR